MKVSWHLLSEVIVIESQGTVDYFGRESKVSLIIGSKGAFDTSVGEETHPAVFHLVSSFTSVTDRTVTGTGRVLVDAQQMLPQMFLIGTSAGPAGGQR